MLFIYIYIFQHLTASEIFEKARGYCLNGFSGITYLPKLKKMNTICSTVKHFGYKIMSVNNSFMYTVQIRVDIYKHKTYCFISVT